MRFMQIESVLQTINRSEPAKNRFSVALLGTYILILRNMAFTGTGGRVKTLPIYDTLKLLFELIFVQ